MKNTLLRISQGTVMTLALFCLFASCLTAIHIFTANAITSGKYDVPTKEQFEKSLASEVNIQNEKKSNSPTGDKFLFNVSPHYDANGNIKSYTVKLKPELINLYKQVGFSSKSKNVAFIYPIFTQAAYSQSGFYDYYKNNCGISCLTVHIPTQINGSYSSSISAVFVLKLLNYSQISDMDIDANPNILKKYDKIIVLHSEYVTKKEFDAITNHPNVVYLFPNALYAQIKINYVNGTITLIRGHGYPSQSITNGFDWKYDNSKYEFDNKCTSWQFTKIQNGKMLNCYPSLSVLTNQTLLNSIKN
jgi:hypothetical protein